FTDDRGVYRIYGLAAGKYLVSAGEAVAGETMDASARTYYPVTYHPGVPSESKATLVDVTPGGETANVDISLGRPLDTFTAAGRVVDADTGKPVGGIQVGYATHEDDGSLRGMSSSPNFRSGVDGAFRIDGISPGRYTLVTVPGDDGFYGDPVPFDVTRSDAVGLEVKMHKGSSIDGTVVVEGTNDPAVLQNIPQLELSADSPQSGTLDSVNPEPDGSFRLGGLAPGKIQINVSDLSKGLSVSRIERNGEVVTQGIDVGACEQISGVRVVLLHGSCTLKGSVKVQGGVLPETVQMSVVAVRVGP